MKYVTSRLSAAILLIVATAFAQPPAAAARCRDRDRLATSLQRGYAGFKNNFTAAAEKMPEADYNFKARLDAGGRTFRRRHRPYRAGAVWTVLGAQGVPNPMAGKQLEQS
jgi:hypothetical protein